MMPVYHPMPDEHGRPVLLKKPSQPTALSAWHEPDAVVTVLPNGGSPAELNGIPFAPWLAVPTSAQAWNRVAGQCACEEPPFDPPAGKRPAAGVVVEEPDGGFWLVAPYNAHGGYTATSRRGGLKER
jgi:hypothetical protein